MAFLSADYEVPRASSPYMKLEEGENKIRILSAPVMGWEDWIETSSGKRPKRYRYEDKPESWANPERPGKHFWAFLVWDYAEDKIRILQINQVSIQKGIQDLSKDEDWGEPFFYDIKINKEGKELRTKYSVNPGRRAPVPDYIREAYEASPCNLEALFLNEDPFSGAWEKVTPGVFEESQVKAKPKVETVSLEQVKELVGLIGDDAAYKKKLLLNLKSAFGIDKLAEIPADKYDSVLKSVKLHVNDRLQKEMDDKPDDLPF